MDKRPDMLERLTDLSGEDGALLERIRAERSPAREPMVFDCRRAEPEDGDTVMALAEDASAYLRSQGVDQWQDGYPSRRIIDGDIAGRRGWLFTRGGEPAGYCCLLMEREPSYDRIDGSWLTDGDAYCAIHRTMIAQEYRGTGLAAEMFALAEELALGCGKLSVRVDTHPDNGPMHGLVKKTGYTLCGIIRVEVGPGHEPRRHAFEKLL